MVSAPWGEEPPQETTLDALLDRFPEARDDPSVLSEAVDQGLVTVGEGGAAAVLSPMLLDAGAELVRVGVPLPAVLELTKAVRADLADVADRFLRLVTEHLLDDLAHARRSPDPARVADVTTALQRLQPVALEVVRPFLAQELRRAVDAVVARYGEVLSTALPDPA